MFLESLLPRLKTVDNFTFAQQLLPTFLNSYTFVIQSWTFCWIPGIFIGSTCQTPILFRSENKVSALIIIIVKHTAYAGVSSISLPTLNRILRCPVCWHSNHCFQSKPVVWAYVSYLKPENKESNHFCFHAFNQPSCMINIRKNVLHSAISAAGKTNIPVSAKQKNWQFGTFVHAIPTTSTNHIFVLLWYISFSQT